jgi:very-short-patch-repair endonuclease
MPSFAFLAGHYEGMARTLPHQVLDWLALQDGVISRSQAVSLGLSPQVIDGQLKSGRWQRLHRGVYAGFTGRVPRRAALWAAVLRAGPDAVLSHQSAAELYGMTKPGGVIHVTVAADHRIASLAGIIVHRSNRLAAARHPALLPARTRIEDTALDLTQAAAKLDDAIAWVCRAVGQRLTTAERLQAAMQARPKVRWRASLRAALDDAESGVQSVLEYRYVRDVERAHGLPPARRQAKITAGGQTRYLDNLYEAAAVVVELDGLAVHPAEARWRDIHRDNAHAGSGLITLRYSWPDITQRPCVVAKQVCAVLLSRKAPVTPRPCRRGCSIRKAS